MHSREHSDGRVGEGWVGGVTGWQPLVHLTSDSRELTEPSCSRLYLWSFKTQLKCPSQYSPLHTSYPWRPSQEHTIQHTHTHSFPGRLRYFVYCSRILSLYFNRVTVTSWSALVVSRYCQLLLLLLRPLWSALLVLTLASGHVWTVKHQCCYTVQYLWWRLTVDSGRLLVDADAATWPVAVAVQSRYTPVWRQSLPPRWRHHSTTRPRSAVQLSNTLANHRPL